MSCQDCFGCIGLRKKQYCIFNKQYSKEDYFQLREKIIEQMNNMPYQDKQGLLYGYGEFFPLEFSSYPYNNTFANFFFPKNKTEILQEGLAWYEIETPKHPITISSSNLPDNLKEITDKITKEIVGCNTCPRGYRIIQQELDLARKMNVPPSRQCPFCRIEEKISKWVTQMKQVERICNQCGISFKTHLIEKEAGKVLCQKCYQQEVY
jgi:hypothetical protein